MSNPSLSEHTRQQIDDMRQRLKDEGKPAPLCLTNNMVRGLNKLFGISEAATEEFIRQHPSPFGD